MERVEEIQPRRYSHLAVIFSRADEFPQPRCQTHSVHCMRSSVQCNMIPLFSVYQMAVAVTYIEAIDQLLGDVSLIVKMIQQLY